MLLFFLWVHRSLIIFPSPACRLLEPFRLFPIFVAMLLGLHKNVFAELVSFLFILIRISIEKVKISQRN